jgi:hypothetical protein
MQDFSHPPAPPVRVTYMSADPSYSVCGWSVRMHRAVGELARLGGPATAGSR